MKKQNTDQKNKEKTTDSCSMLHGELQHGLIWQEFLHHTPYGIFSVALSLMLLSLLHFANPLSAATHEAYDTLFHTFHFIHILFATTATVTTLRRFSPNESLLTTLVIAIVSPSIFCMVSDVLLPYVAGTLLGASMELHICFYSELYNIIPFLILGIINGFILSYQHSKMLNIISLSSHFGHILISSLASLFYLVSHGVFNWYLRLGYLALFLLVTIVIPCTLSDVIVPLYVAYFRQKNQSQCEDPTMSNKQI